MIGWTVLWTWVIAYDTWALKKGKPTLSRSLYQANKRPAIRFVTSAIAGGIVYHLAAEHELRDWLDKLQSNQGPVLVTPVTQEEMQRGSVLRVFRRNPKGRVLGVLPPGKGRD